MNTYAFDERGYCIGAINDHVELADFPSAQYIKHAAPLFQADTLWLDVERNQLMFRAPLPAKVSANKISSLPPGTVAIVSGVSVEVDDGTLELEVEYPASVMVILTHLKYLEKIVEVPCEVSG